MKGLLVCVYVWVCVRTCMCVCMCDLSVFSKHVVRPAPFILSDERNMTETQGGQT